MALYANVIKLPYVDAGMTGEHHATDPLLVNVPSFEFSTSNFVNTFLYRSDSTLSDSDKKNAFVDELNKSTSSLWSTLDMIKRWPHSHDECTVYTHFKKRFGDLTHSGPWPLDEGDRIHVLPPLEVRELIDRNNTYISNYKLHKNDTVVYSHPMIISETMFLELYREIAKAKSKQHPPVPESALGRILGSKRMKQINWSINRFLKPGAMVVHKNGVSGYDNKICVGDSMTVEWLNR